MHVGPRAGEVFKGIMSGILDQVLHLDVAVFQFLYSFPHWLFLNWVMSFFSALGSAGLVWVLISAIAVWPKKDFRLFLRLMAVLGIVFFSVLVLKQAFHRPRPFNGGFSFPSGHAAGSFAMSAVLSSIKKKWRRSLLILAVIVSYSRVYLGRHYPLDVIAGSLMGIGLGLAFSRILVQNKENWLPD
ncbi:hypothetical protein B5M47_01395 [candidate division CPR3 bacterium 4484_211]|uniref:Phosphatidic acid phosphatase type 2/haloperoxidase domain-containing protein n=1 Tax=candidate division CPR3 bacterium 4484_211 TaxID=1968527 RepID=A0A1W9NYN4_UNCC3|nr:MAG: hypothetical protein B5M47_01395 [candidate division CPR3 bacterium 4484_211]